MVPCEYSFSFFFEYVNHSLLQGKKILKIYEKKKKSVEIIYERYFNIWGLLVNRLC